ncbi:MAG: amidophosphoribosyltransferase [Candidatus Micrarchaeia archaeon]
MREEKREECGVFGILRSDRNGTAEINNQSSAPYIYKGIFSLQHRGQNGAGIATIDIYSNNKNNVKTIYIKKGANLVNRVFEEFDLNELKGNLGVGSVRYPTVGHSTDNDAQPFFSYNVRNGILLSHNGNLVNYKEIRENLINEGVEFSSDGDAEIMLKLLELELKKRDDIVEAVKNLMNKVEGAYSDVVATGYGELIAFRDPHGIRPLSFGSDKENKIVAFASESVAFDINNLEKKWDLEPGEVVVVTTYDGGYHINRKIIKNEGRKHCFFEYVYFSRPDSYLDAGSVYNIRVKLGELLASIEPVEADFVVPVPDTARPAADGYSKVSGIPVAEGLIKNRYISRTFIMPLQKTRDDGVRFKFNLNKEIIKNKKIILIDDSIVRGTTLKKIIAFLKDGGATEIHVRITAPQIISPCFYGIDMSNHKQLIAYQEKNDINKIRERIGATSLVYLSQKKLVEAIGLKRTELCLACLNGKYPTSIAQKLADSMKNSDNDKERYYE